jgi:UDP-N-acetylglucosamine--N-acetylmuramyl-(pentapeptide) pyrophosphoryl-undecaprenol N-acetylglucosamine transferase
MHYIFTTSWSSRLGVAYLAPYGVGLGHASRLVMVADQLKKSGIDIMFSSFGEAASYVKMHGYRCTMVPPMEFAWGVDGGFSVKSSISNIPVWFANFARQVNQEIRNMTAYCPDVVVSDSRLSPILAARILRIPSIVVLNQLKLLLSPRLRDFAISRLFENTTAEVLGSMWALAERVLVPDLPPPNTISWHNVWGTGAATRRLEYVGFTTPEQQPAEEAVERVAQSLGLDRSRPMVYVHISGPSQTRSSLLKIAQKAAESLDDKIQFVISEGKPGGRTEPQKISSHIWYYEWCPVRDEVYALSDLTVLRGGHVALSQAIRLGKPVVTIPIENHSEQLGNSTKVADIGIGVMLLPKNLEADRLAAAIVEVLATPRFSEKARELQRQSATVNGIGNISNIVKAYCQ